MDMKKRFRLIVGAAAAFAVTVPVAVFAAIYSGSRTNEFTPAQTNIQVKEDNSQGDRLESQEYTFSKPDGEEYYITNKSVSIYDGRAIGSDELRVRLVPMWYDAGGNIMGGIEGVTDLSIPELNDEETKLIYYSGQGSSRAPAITLHLTENWKTSGWSFISADGSFTFSGELSSDKTTPQLISKVELSKDAHNRAEGLTLELDVLADAIQKSGGAAEKRLGT